MRISFHIEGGFAHVPGFATPRTIDLDALPAAAAAQLEALADRALRAKAPPPTTGGADQRRFVITIERGNHVRRLSFEEPVTDPAIALLCERLRAMTMDPVGGPRT